MLCRSRHRSFVYLAQVSTLLNRHIQKFWLSLREALVLAGAKWIFGSVAIEMLRLPQWSPDFLSIMPGFGSLLSSEYGFGLINWFSLTLGGVFSFTSPACVEKLCD
jgi:hypothetical protein